MTRLAVCLLFAATALAAPPPPDPAAVAEVKAGTRTVAHATWWGFDPANATAGLQAALDSGAKEVIVDDVGQPWIVDGIQPRSNTVVTFAKGCEVQARRGQFKGTNDCLVRLSGVHDVTLSGYGATLRMWRDDYDDPAQYKKAEWRHSVSILSSRNIQVLGLRLIESGGDGIYLGVSQRGVTNTDVLIRDVLCDRHYRQGISVISAENLTIENTQLNNTAGTAPMAGIDFEPNHAEERVVNCVMRGCTVAGNAGPAIAFYLVPLTAKSPPVTVRVEDCTTQGSPAAVVLTTTNGHADGDVGGLVEFTRCRFVRPERGIWVRHKPADGLALRFEDCDLIDPAPSHPTTAPVTLSAQRGAKHPVGGLELRNLTVTDALGRVPLALDGWAGGLGVQKVSGRLRLRGKDGAEEIVELTPERLAAWLPESALIGILPYPATPLRPLEPGADPTAFGLAQAKVRGRGTWLIHASAGDSVRCTLRYGQVGSYAGEPMPATVTAPSGAVAASVKAAFKADTELSFEARETGLYRLVADAGRNHVALSASSHPASVTADGEPLAFIAAAGTLWFWVPADVATFAVVCAGDGQEGVRASLLDAGGRLVEERDNISRPHQFVVKRAPGAAGEAWQLRLAKPSALAFEDFVVQLQGVPPLLAGARQGLLTPAP